MWVLLEGLAAVVLELGQVREGLEQQVKVLLEVMEQQMAQHTQEAVAAVVQAV
jgi:protein required for attachment to host cells